MSDLRQRLAEAIEPYEGDTVMHGSSAPEMADEALAVFADWLRERAARCATSIGEGALLDAADEIASTGGEG